MDNGLLSSALNWIDRQKQTTKASLGLLADNPKEWTIQTTARYLPTKEEEYQYDAVSKAGEDITQTPYYQKIFNLAQFQGSIKPSGLLSNRSLYNAEGLPNRGRDLIRNDAENLANILRNQGFEVNLQHSGSAAGPSSYLQIYDPTTGRFFKNDVRLSGHSKGAFNSQGVWDVTNKEFDDVVNVAKEMRSLGKPEWMIERDRIELEKRLKSADKKIAKGKQLTISEQEAVNARNSMTPER